MEQLTPQQKAFLVSLWRLQQSGGVPRRRRIAHGVAAGLAILFLVVGYIGILKEWGPMVIWFVAFFSGICVASAATTRTNIRLWPAGESIIDWERLKAIVDRGETP